MFTSLLILSILGFVYLCTCSSNPKNSEPMNTEISGVTAMDPSGDALLPLGVHIAKVYRGERTWLDFMAPVERGIYRFCGIDRPWR